MYPSIWTFKILIKGLVNLTALNVNFEHFENPKLLNTAKQSQVVYSKNSWVRFDPEKGPMGPDPFLGQTDLESG